MYDFNWEVELVFNPDTVLVKNNNVVISSDGWILDRVDKWFNLGNYLIENRIEDASVISV